MNSPIKTGDASFSGSIPDGVPLQNDRFTVVGLKRQLIGALTANQIQGAITIQIPNATAMPIEKHIGTGIGLKHGGGREREAGMA